MRCQYCGKRLPLFRKLTDGEFCSPAHRKLFFDQQEQLALGRLLETGKRGKNPTRANLEAELAAAQAGGSGNGRKPVITETSVPPAWDRILGDRPPLIPLGEIADVVPVPLHPSVALLLPEPERSLYRLQGSLSVDQMVEFEPEVDRPAEPRFLAPGEAQPLPIPAAALAFSARGPALESDWGAAPEAGIRALWRADFLSSRGWKATLVSWEPRCVSDDDAPLNLFSPGLASLPGDFTVELIHVEPNLVSHRLVEHLATLHIAIPFRAGAELSPRDWPSSPALTAELAAEFTPALTIEPFEFARGPVAHRHFDALFSLTFTAGPAAPLAYAILTTAASAPLAPAPARFPLRLTALRSTSLGHTHLAPLAVELGAPRPAASAPAKLDSRPLRFKRRVLGVRPTRKQIDGFEPALAQRMKPLFANSAVPARTVPSTGIMLEATRTVATRRPRVALDLRGGRPTRGHKLQSLPFLIRPLDGLALTERAADWIVTAQPLKPRLKAQPLPPGPRNKAEAVAAKLRTTGSSISGKLWAHAPADIRWVTMIIPLVLFLAWYSFTPKGQVITRQGAQGSVSVPTVPVSTSGFSSVFRSFEERISARAAVELSDDFRSGLGNWEGEGEWSDSWSYDQAGFVHPGRLALYKPSVALSDYKLEFLGKIEKKSLSWVYRASDLRNYYGAKLTVLQNGPVPKVALVRYTVVNGRETNRKQILIPLNTLRQDTIYRVRVDLNGDQITTSVLGQIVDTYRDTTHARGGVGFFAPRGEESRLRWVELSHQYDTLGRLCALIVPYGAASPETRTP